MFKKLMAAFIASAMLIASSPVMADSEEVITGSFEETIEIGLMTQQGGAMLIDDDEPDPLEVLLREGIEAQQTEGEVCYVKVEGLKAFELDYKPVSGKMSEDARYVFNIYTTLVQSYNITQVWGNYSDDYTLESITFEIDNSMSTDEIAEIVSDRAAERIESKKEYSDFSDQFYNLPLGTVLTESDEVLAKVQAARPELCFIQVLNVGIALQPSYEQRDGVFHAETNPVITFDYLDIDYDEYNAFEKKLDDIVYEVVYPDMSNAEKAMALHDWIVENVEYGYRLDSRIYQPASEQSYHTIFNLDAYTQLMELIGSEEMEKSKAYAHTAYAPAMLGYGVCQGYTLLYAALLDKVGIENGTFISNYMHHQWSMVELDGKWYFTDVTWDDPTPNTERDKDSYNIITLNLTDGSKIEMYEQTEHYHNYSNFLMNDESCVAEGHITTQDPTAVKIPESAECTDDSFYAVDENSGEAVYSFARVYYDKLYYCDSNKMYYFGMPVKFNGEDVVWYHKIPFKLLGDDGVYTEPQRVTDEEFAAVLEGTFVEPPEIPDEPKDYVTVEIPDEVVIDNSVEVECKVESENEAEQTELTIENIGTAVMNITQKEAETEEPALTEVDAYLVYYGENNTILDIIMQTVQIDGSGEVKFDAELPEGAAEAKIIILDGGAELVPVIKAIGVSAD